jgi:hypothetical protein
MGENLEEVEEFDRIMQSVAEGTYHPSHSAMETFPVSYDVHCIALQRYVMHMCRYVYTCTY